jgi:hypothetical protein
VPRLCTIDDCAGRLRRVCDVDTGTVCLASPAKSTAQPMRTQLIPRFSRLAAALPVMAVLAWTSGSAHAQRIENEIAVFAALDKVTARISRLEIGLGQTVRFGSIVVTPRSCYSRPPTELPKTTAFVEVVEVKLDGAQKPLFSGWMFAESPGLNAVEHPVFDVWLTECGKPVGRKPATAAVEGGQTGAGQPPAVAQPAEEPRRRPKR